MKKLLVRLENELEETNKKVDYYSNIIISLEEQILTYNTFFKEFMLKEGYGIKYTSDLLGIKNLSELNTYLIKIDDIRTLKLLINKLESQDTLTNSYKFLKKWQDIALRETLQILEIKEKLED